MQVVLFNVLPQLIDITVTCVYLALKLEKWIAVIVFVTVASYVAIPPPCVYVCSRLNPGCIHKDIDTCRNDTCRNILGTDARLVLSSK